MGRVPCCEKDNVKRGLWTPDEDNKLLSYISQHGTRNWRLIPKNAGLQRCGKSCRVRWTNYLLPGLKRGEFADDMGRLPRCQKENVKRGQWTPEEDEKLFSYISQHGTRNWHLVARNAGLQRSGKSCCLRWTNYLRPDLKHGEFTDAEEQTVIELHSVVGNKWPVIAAQLPGRTYNDVRKHWNTKLKELSGMATDPVTHKSLPQNKVSTNGTYTKNIVKTEVLTK